MTRLRTEAVKQRQKERARIARMKKVEARKNRERERDRFNQLVSWPVPQLILERRDD